MKRWTLQDVNDYLCRYCDDEAWLHFRDILFNIMNLGVIKFVSMRGDADTCNLEYKLIKVEIERDGKFRGSKEINQELLEIFRPIIANKNVIAMRLCYDFGYYECEENIPCDKILN